MKKRILVVGMLLAAIATGQQQVTFLGGLPGEVAESSGLVCHGNSLVTHNDSGNEPFLYVLDPATRQMSRKVLVSNATNIDWEDVAQDDKYLYIADIGNYNGNRRDLVIYRVALADFASSDTVDADRIEYIYEDQAVFSGSPRSDWDAEALMVIGDNLLIFTKQWQSNGTKAYMVPAVPGKHVARLAGSYSSNGLITGAAYNKFSGVAYLCGYSLLLQPFLIRMEGAVPNAPFAGKVTRTSMDLAMAQVEGIAAYDASTYFLSSEEFLNNMPAIGMEASLFKFITKDKAVVPPAGGQPPPEEEPGTGQPDEGEGQGELLIYKTFGANAIEYEINREEPVYGRAVFDILGRRVLYTAAGEFDGNTIDISPLGSAVYYLTFYLQGKTITKPFFID